MKFQRSVLAVASAAVLLNGCVAYDGTIDHTSTGILGGAAYGAGTGAIIGGPRYAGQGALIGAAIGALTGGLIGHSIDESQRARLREEYPTTLERVEQGQPLSIADVKAMAKAGVSDDVILGQIRQTRSSYQLSTAEIIELKQAGVSEPVIDYMIKSPSVGSPPPGEPSEVSSEAPPPQVREEVTAAPGPGYVWVSGYWGWYGHRWVWIQGRWIREPYRHAYWVPGRWVWRGYGWLWVPGHWR